jgi:translation initiation factor 1 (eIF-1/SUI1)
LIFDAIEESGFEWKLLKKNLRKKFALDYNLKDGEVKEIN